MIQPMDKMSKVRAVPATKKLHSQKKTTRVKKIISYVLLTLVGLVLITPLLWMIFTSVKPMAEIVRFPPTFFPETINFDNYLKAIQSFPFWQYAKNTLFITVLVVLGNDFLGPLLYIQDQSKYTLQIGLQVFQNQSTTQWNYLMAGATLVLLPTVLLFFFAQRYFIEGMDLTGGSKG